MVIESKSAKNIQFISYALTIVFMIVSIWNIYDMRKIRKEELELKKRLPA